MIRTLIIILCLGGSMACNSQSGKSERSNEELIRQIDSLEQFINKEDFTFDNDAAALQLATALEEYVDQNKNDEKCPSYLFKAAGLHKNLGDNDMAIKCFNRIWSEYPDHKRAPDALFLEALMYEEDKNDVETAKSRYNKFLELYPENEFAASAKQVLLLIDKTPAERYEYLKDQE